MSVKVFSKEQYIEVCGYDKYLEFRNWVDECEGKEVIDGLCLNKYLIIDEWCVEKGDQIMEFTKDDLKTGMVVEYANGEKALVLVGEFETDCYGKQNVMFIDSCGFMNGSSYNSDLFDVDEDREDDDYTIVKIYKPCVHGLEDMLRNCNEQTLIWERGVDWSKVPVDTKILVSFNGKDWYKRYFAKYEEGFVYAFENGATSWSADVEPFSWTHIKLAEEED